MTRPRATNPATAGQVFRLVHDGVATTRSAIGRATGLSRTAVAARLGALVDAGLVVETEDAGTGVGRPPARLRVDAGAGVVLAAAIGRSRTQVAVVDLVGHVLAQDDFDQEIGLLPDELLPRVAAALTSSLDRAGRDPDAVRGIGVSIPGTVRSDLGCSYESPIMAGWHEVPLAPYFESVSSAPTYLDNDTNVIALAERSGHLAAYRDVLIVKASTGFGVGVVAGGVLQRGALGAAGDIGHVKYQAAAGLDCRCGERGCLEALAGGWALVRTMQDLGTPVGHVRDVARLALSGDVQARHAVRESGRHLGTVLAGAVMLLNPAAVVIGGDLAPAYDTFVAGLRETLYRDASALATRDLDIVSATYGDQSGVRGCAELVLDSVLSAAMVDDTVRRAGAVAR